MKSRKVYLNRNKKILFDSEMGWDSILGNTRMTQEASTQTGREWWRKTRGTGRRLKVRPSEEKEAEVRSAVVDGRDTYCYWAHWVLPVFVIKTSMKGLTGNSGRPIRWVKRGGDLPFYKYRNIRFQKFKEKGYTLNLKVMSYLAERKEIWQVH